MSNLHHSLAALLFAFASLLCSSAPFCYADIKVRQKKEPAQQEHKIELWPEAKTTLFKQVGILPFPETHSLFNQARTIVYEQLELENIYPVLPLEATAELSANLILEPDTDIDQPLPARAIIWCQLLDGTDDILSTSSEQMLLTFTDIPSKKNIWRITIDLPDAERQDAATALQNAIGAALVDLRTHLVQHGAIFSVLIPAPEIVSTDGLLKETRVVINPLSKEIHQSYQLLRGNSYNDTFKLIGKPVVNNTSPITLEDTMLEDGTTYYYSVIGFTPAGLASVPGLPVAITTIRE